jgi:hypothetical protein
MPLSWTTIFPKQPGFQQPECTPPCHLVWTTRTGLGMWECQCPVPPRTPLVPTETHFEIRNGVLYVNGIPEQMEDRQQWTPPPPPPPTALVTTQAHPATSFWQQSWFLVGAGVLGGFFAVKLLKKSRTTKNPPGERGRLLEQIDEAISRRDSRKVGSIVEMLRFKYGLKHGQIFDMFKKAHPGLTMAAFDALLEESEE